MRERDAMAVSRYGKGVSISTQFTTLSERAGGSVGAGSLLGVPCEGHPESVALAGVHHLKA